MSMNRKWLVQSKKKVAVVSIVYSVISFNSLFIIVSEEDASSVSSMDDKSSSSDPDSQEHSGRSNKTIRYDPNTKIFYLIERF